VRDELFGIAPVRIDVVRELAFRREAAQIPFRVERVAHVLDGAARSAASPQAGNTSTTK